MRPATTIAAGGRGISRFPCEVHVRPEDGGRCDVLVWNRARAGWNVVATGVICDRQSDDSLKAASLSLWSRYLPRMIDMRANESGLALDCEHGLVLSQRAAPDGYRIELHDATIGTSFPLGSLGPAKRRLSLWSQQWGEMILVKSEPQEREWYAYTRGGPPRLVSRIPVPTDGYPLGQRPDGSFVVLDEQGRVEVIGPGPGERRVLH